MNTSRFLSAALGAAVVASAAAPAAAAPLPRANVVLKSALSVDVAAQTAVLPLHRGHVGSRTVWYIVTDSTDRADATKRGVNYAPLLANVGAGCAACVEHVSERAGEIVFTGAPDFSKTRGFTAGPTGFPPKSASPGATAGADYSPFVRIGNAATIVDAPIVATGDGPFDVTKHTNTHDRVVAIDPAKQTVTILLVHGFANGKPVLYLSTEASDAGVATIERATFVPSLGKAVAGTIPIDVVANGPRGARPQGLAFAALDGKLDADATVENAATLRAPMNVLASFPTGTGAGAYTPLWSASVGVWSDAAIAAKHAVQLTTTAGFDAAVASHELTGPGGKPFGPIGVVVNCPVVAYIDAAP